MTDIDICHFPVILRFVSLVKLFLLNQLLKLPFQVILNFLHHSLDVVHILLILPEQEDKLRRFRQENFQEPC